MKENNMEKPEEFKPMALDEYEEIVERLEKGEKIVDLYPDEQKKMHMDEESWLSTVFGNGLMQYKPAEGEEEKLKELQERAIQVTNKIRENK